MTYEGSSRVGRLKAFYLPVTKDIHLANTLRTPFPPRLLALALGVWLGPESPERLSRWNTF